MKTSRLSSSFLVILKRLFVSFLTISSKTTIMPSNRLRLSPYIFLHDIHDHLCVAETNISNKIAINHESYGSSMIGSWVV